MDNVNSNTSDSTQSAAPQAPTSTGPNAEELAAKVAELERAREGLIRDVQQERSKRQELEQRFSAPAPVQPTPTDVNGDELGKVLNPYIAPVARQVQETQKFVSQYYQDKAVDLIASKTGKSVDAVMNDTVLQERIVSTARKWGFQGNPYEVAQKALRAMELEDSERKEQERARTSQAASQQSMPAGAPPVSSSASRREYSATEFEKMPLHEFDKLSSNGQFVLDSDSGKYVYTAR